MAASSRAIWKPELPPPTTTAGPSGSASGLRYSALCSWITESSSPAAGGGTNGIWNGPVATITCRAAYVRSAVLSWNPPSVRRSPVTRASSSTGRAKAAA